jgi:hypothetical protein
MVILKIGFHFIYVEDTERSLLDNGEADAEALYLFAYCCVFPCSPAGLS